jgi:hypothetical protein
VLLRLDVRARAQARPHELAADRVAEALFRQEQEVVVRAAPDAEDGDHSPLRRQQQRGAGAADRQLLDVVRDHPLEEVGRLRPAHADVVAGHAGDP